MNPLTITASTKAIEKVVGDLYDVSKDTVREKVKRWKAVKKIRDLSKKLMTIRKVKTIWQIEKEVDLMGFYYPARIVKRKDRTDVRSLVELTREGNVLLQGTLGQGKSILLRYLCVQELYLGQVIPVFVELRRYEGGTKLLEYLLEALDILGLGSDPKIFEFLAASGKIIICLDGFDEVSAALRGRLVQQIETLCSKYDDLRIVITSRPENGIETSPFFRVLRLAPLSRGDVRGIIAKLTNDPKFTEEITAAIERRKGDIDSLLTTPLMVTLLVISYKAEQQIPETLAEFYESLFNTMLVRHDKLKTGFQRERKSGLNDRQIRLIFDTMCFQCRRQQLATIDRETLYDICSHATKLCQIECDPQDFISDINHITCLLLAEGEKYHFIHKSVSEYHSASYIKRTPEAASQRFYSHMLTGRFGNWQQELIFLRQIDAYRFGKFFLLPDILKFMASDEKSIAAGGRDGFLKKIIAIASSSPWRNPLIHWTP